jgi:AraC-like DNA-binding protein
MLILYTLTCGSAFLLAFLLMGNSLQVNKLANRWLAVVLLCFGCALLDRILPGTWLDSHYPAVLGVVELTRLAMSPALYLSVMMFTQPDYRFRARDLSHFLPWALFILYALPLLGRWAWLPPVPLSQVVRALVFYSTKIQAVVYWGLAYWQLVRHQRHVRLLAAEVGAIDLAWLRYLLLGLALLLVLWLNEVFFQVELLQDVTPAGYLAATFALGYFALRQREVFAFAPAARAEVTTVLHAAEAVPAPTRPPRLPPAQVQAMQQQLLHLMTTERLFLEPDLSLPTLAQRVGASLHELSYVLNEVLEESFFQFVNRYRVEEAKRLLVSAQHRHLSILGIGFEAGFSSKTTFNTTFKKMTGLSPSQFAQNQGDAHPSASIS